MKGASLMKPFKSRRVRCRIASIGILSLFGLTPSISQPDEDCAFSLCMDRLQRLGEVLARPTLSGPVLNINTTNFKDPLHAKWVGRHNKRLGRIRGGLC